MSPTFPGYEPYNSPTEGRATVLVNKALTAVGVDNIPETNIDHVIVELVLRRKKKAEKRSIIIVNVYSAPKQKYTDFHAFVKGACKLAQGKELLLLGDFNALEERWGARTTSCLLKYSGNALAITTHLNLRRRIRVPPMILSTDQ
ncbi:hypothetical protein HPB50_006148 [Hyalomma asiaticum]|uniref:Uncharacterized protein n=1 Tax=Hyalomma asiaticum TaxID=266040 RepID=A0ACB7TD96_HYAAI|nr:hypothetical protein HPB50_006148 [Hyalomma asiaticum]